MKILKRQEFDTLREFRLIDHGDHRNEGLVSDRLVETSEGYEIRQIICVDPSSGTQYRYLTNEKTLPARVVFLLYKHRWDIEKTFDGTKT
jgi:IS4 transposase